MAADEKTKSAPIDIERVGAGGVVGEGQGGTPLHQPQGKRDRALGPRERVGAGGTVGKPEAQGGEASAGDAVDEVVTDEQRRGEVNPAAEPDQKDDI